MLIIWNNRVSQTDITTEIITELLVRLLTAT